MLLPKETKDKSSIEYECKADSRTTTTTSGNTQLKIKDKICFRVDTGSDGINVQVDYYNNIDQETIDTTSSSTKESKKQVIVYHP